MLESGKEDNDTRRELSHYEQRLFYLTLRPFAIGLLISCMTIPQLPSRARQDGTEEDLGDTMTLNFKNVVKFNWGLQGSMQDEGATNMLGAGFFYPFNTTRSQTWFIDSRADLNLGDYNISPSHYGIEQKYEYLSSSINDIQVQGTSVSTSTRIGYRWIDRKLSRGFGIAAGYDSRPLVGGYPMDDHVKEEQASRAGGPKTRFFQQVALSAVTVSEKLKISAYGLFPIGKYGIGSKNVPTIYGQWGASPLMTTGIDIEHETWPKVKLLTGIYYQSNQADPPLYVDPVAGFGIKAKVTKDLSDNHSIYLKASGDINFNARLSGGFIVRFRKTNQRLKGSRLANFLNSSPDYRYVRINCSEPNPTRQEEEQCGA